MHKSFLSVLTIALLFLMNTKSFSQNDFREGYIVTNSYDTVWGFIDYMKPRISSEFCFFKKDSLDKVATLTPATIRSYKFSNGKYFTRKQVTINKKSNYYFFEYLVDGILDLYFLNLEGSY